MYLTKHFLPRFITAFLLSLLLLFSSANSYTTWHKPEFEHPQRVAFPALCLNHFYDETKFTKNVWLEPCEIEYIYPLKQYLEFIPLNFEPDCYGCQECKGLCLDLINDTEYGLDDRNLALEEISSLHTYGKDGLAYDCNSGSNFHSHCNGLCWEGNYFRKWNQKYFHFFQHYLLYCSQNPECDCYWVEKNETILDLNDEVYNLFKELASNNLITPEFSSYWVAKIVGYRQSNGERKYFKEYYPNAHGMAASLSTYTFFYSQYHKTLLDVAAFIDQNTICNNENTLEKIYKTLDRVRQTYIRVYNSCLKSHPHPKIYYERGLLHMHCGNSERALQDIHSMMTLAKNDKCCESDFLTSEMYQQEGEAYADMGIYDKAIKALTNAIEKDPSNKEAYFHRAAAYFEMGNFDCAISDYLSSDKHTRALFPKKVSTDFTKALSIGVLKGAEEAAQDFVPSLLNSAYGLSETLWIFGQHPIEQTVRFANACYEATRCAIEYCQGLNWQKVEGYSEEFKYLCEKFSKLNDVEKGESIGHLIGKYGVEILAPGVTLKGVAKYKQLRDLNRICNLEAMILSNTNKEIVVAAAVKHSSDRANFFKQARINWDKQNKHIPGKHNYRPESSTITLDSKDLEYLVKTYVGKGQKITGEVGKSGYKERIEFGKIIGEYAQKIEGQPTKYFPTSKGIVVYAKDGSLHVIPSNPKGFINE